MKYIGNIEKLRNSVFVKDKKRPLRVSPRLRKLINGIVMKYINSNVNKEDLMKEYNISEEKAKFAISELKRYRTSIKTQTDENNNVLIDNKFIESYDKLCCIKKQYTDEIRIHGEQTLIQEGFVYLITNPSWNGWIKAGMTIDYQSRLNTYNINDPYGNYNYLSLKWVENRRQSEQLLLETLTTSSINRKGEWFQISEDEATKIFCEL